ncbi:MAG: hypothetical protein MI784_14010, partial [Cytophagales bacterium]|nr:hypothetical protein [Cytophagales bacterium]
KKKKKGAAASEKSVEDARAMVEEPIEILKQAGDPNGASLPVAEPKKKKKRKKKKSAAEEVPVEAPREEDMGLPDLSRLSLEGEPVEPEFEEVKLGHAAKPQAIEIFPHGIEQTRNPFEELKEEETGEIGEGACFEPAEKEETEEKKAKKKRKKKRHVATPEEGVQYISPEYLEENIKFADFQRDLGVDKMEHLPPDTAEKLVNIQSQFDDHVLDAMMTPWFKRQDEEFKKWESGLRHHTAVIKTGFKQLVPQAKLLEFFDTMRCRTFLQVHDYDLSRFIPSKYSINFKDPLEKNVFQLVLKMTYCIAMLRFKEDQVYEIVRYQPLVLDFIAKCAPEACVANYSQRIKKELMVLYNGIPAAMKYNVGTEETIYFRFDNTENDIGIREKMWDSLLPKVRDLEDETFRLLHFVLRLTQERLTQYLLYVKIHTQGRLESYKWSTEEHRSFFEGFLKQEAGSQGASAP